MRRSDEFDYKAEQQPIAITDLYWETDLRS
jgi:hypothetical protein